MDANARVPVRLSPGHREGLEQTTPFNVAKDPRDPDQEGKLEHQLLPQPWSDFSKPRLLKP
jgi:hypothetical protein